MLLQANTFQEPTIWENNEILFIGALIFGTLAIFAGWVIMIAGYRNEIKKLKKTNSDVLCWINFLEDIKSIRHFPALLDKYQKLENIAPLPDTSFWREPFQKKVDQILLGEMNLLCNSIERHIEVLEPKELLERMKQGEGIIWNGERFASLVGRKLLKENFDPPFYKMLAKLENFPKSQEYSLAIKIKESIYPKPVPAQTYREPVWLAG